MIACSDSGFNDPDLTIRNRHDIRPIVGDDQLVAADALRCAARSSRLDIIREVEQFGCWFVTA